MIQSLFILLSTEIMLHAQRLLYEFLIECLRLLDWSNIGVRS